MIKFKQLLYPKIPTIFKRDSFDNFRYVAVDLWSSSELKYLASLEWEWSELIEGVLIRLCWDGALLSIRGKNLSTKAPAQIEKQFIRAQATLKSKFLSFFGSEGHVSFFCIAFGSHLKQGGKYGKTQQINVFDINIEDNWLQRDDIKSMCNKFDLNPIPIVGTGSLNNMIGKVEKGFNSYYGNFLAAGIVARPLVELKDHFNNRIITKLKYKDFRRT